MQPLSNDLRRRILEAVDNREGSRRPLAARFKGNTSTITRLLQLRRQTGSLEPRPHGGGVEPTLAPEALRRPRKLVEEAPDATLETLRQGVGIAGSQMIICRALQKLGLPRKKESPHASERDTPEVEERRREFREQAAPIEPRRLAFVDETGVTTAMTPAYGRAPLAFEGAVDGATFLACVEQVPVPALRRGDVVVFENLGAHLSAAVSEAIGRAGAMVMPLRPYSPDFNPIEELPSKFKEFQRRVGARAKESLYDAIGAGLREATPEDILGGFRLAGPCVMRA
jgi:transposase